MVSHLQHKNPDTTILLVAALPAAFPNTQHAQGMYPWPNEFTPSVSHVSQALQAFAWQHEAVEFLDCANECLLMGRSLCQPDN